MLDYLLVSVSLLFIFSVVMLFYSKQRQLNVALQKLVLVGIQVRTACTMYVVFHDVYGCLWIHVYNTHVMTDHNPPQEPISTQEAQD